MTPEPGYPASPLHIRIARESWRSINGVSDWLRTNGGRLPRNHIIGLMIRGWLELPATMRREIVEQYLDWKSGREGKVALVHESTLDADDAFVLGQIRFELAARGIEYASDALACCVRGWMHLDGHAKARLIERRRVIVLARDGRRKAQFTW